MFRDRRFIAVAIALGVSVSLLFSCGEAVGGGVAKTRLIVERPLQLWGSILYSVTLDGRLVGYMGPGSTLDLQVDLQSDRVNVLRVQTVSILPLTKEIRFVPHGETVTFQVWCAPGWLSDEIKAEVTQGASIAGPANVGNVTLGDAVIVRKFDSEEFTLQEGVTLHASRSSTLQRGVNLSRSIELLLQAGVEGGVNAGAVAKVKAEIGARVTDMLSNEIHEAMSTGNVVELDGSVLEKARIDWYARIRPGKATLEAKGSLRELPFEYTIGYEPRIVGTPRRRPTVPHVATRTAPPTFQPAVDRSLPRLGGVTAVSKERPRLFEAQFETAPFIVQGEKLPVYRGRLESKCVGLCKVVAVQGCRIVAECEGCTPQVGDMVAGGAALGPKQTP